MSILTCLFCLTQQFIQICNDRHEREYFCFWEQLFIVNITSQMYRIPTLAIITLNAHVMPSKVVVKPRKKITKEYRYQNRSFIRDATLRRFPYTLPYYVLAIALQTGNATQQLTGGLPKIRETMASWAIPKSLNLPRMVTFVP